MASAIASPTIARPTDARTPASTTGRGAMGSVVRRWPAALGRWLWASRTPPRVRLHLRADLPRRRRIADRNDRVRAVTFRRAGPAPRPGGRRRAPGRGRAGPGLG